MKTALAIVGGITVASWVVLFGVLLLNHVSTEWKARQYRRQWDGTDTGSETPLFDAISQEFAARDLTDEAIARWVGDGR